MYNRIVSYRLGRVDNLLNTTITPEFQQNEITAMLWKIELEDATFICGMSSPISIRISDGLYRMDYSDIQVTDICKNDKYGVLRMEMYAKEGGILRTLSKDEIKMLHDVCPTYVWLS